MQYLVSLAKPLGVKFDDNHFMDIVGDPSIFPIDDFLGVLPDRASQTAWLVDAVALVAMRGEILPTHAGIIQQVAVALDVPVAHCEEVIPAAITLVSAADRREVLEAIRDLAPMSHAWRTVFDFRRMDLRGALSEEHAVIEQLLGQRRALA